MIARKWDGKVPTIKADNYHTYLLETGLKDYAAIEGNRGVFLLKRTEDDITHFDTLTFWTDVEAIKKFAGEDFGKARYYDEDKNFLLEFETLVIHFEVVEMKTNFNE